MHDMTIGTVSLLGHKTKAVTKIVTKLKSSVRFHENQFWRKRWKIGEEGVRKLKQQQCFSFPRVARITQALNACGESETIPGNRSAWHDVSWGSTFEMNCWSEVGLRDGCYVTKLWLRVMIRGSSKKLLLHYYYYYNHNRKKRGHYGSRRNPID